MSWTLQVGDRVRRTSIDASPEIVPAGKEGVVVSRMGDHIAVDWGKLPDEPSTCDCGPWEFKAGYLEPIEAPDWSDTLELQ